MLLFNVAYDAPKKLRQITIILTSSSLSEGASKSTDSSEEVAASKSTDDREDDDAIDRSSSVMDLLILSFTMR